MRGRRQGIVGRLDITAVSHSAYFRNRQRMRAIGPYEGMYIILLTNRPLLKQSVPNPQLSFRILGFIFKLVFIF